MVGQVNIVRLRYNWDFFLDFFVAGRRKFDVESTLTLVIFDVADFVIFSFVDVALFFDNFHFFGIFFIFR